MTVYAHRLRSSIAAMAPSLGGSDALVCAGFVFVSREDLEIDAQVRAALRACA
jgi:acetate kinase